MKKILLSALVLIGLSAKAQYFQSLYGERFPTEFLSDGHNSYTGGPPNSGHFLISPGGGGPPGTRDKIHVTRTDLNGAVGGPFTFNNSYYITDVPPGPIPSLNSQEVRSVEFSGGNGFAIAGSYVNGGSGNPRGIYYTHIDPNGNVVTSRGYFQDLSIYGIFHSDVHVMEITESVSNPGDLYICGYLTKTTGQNRVFVIKIDQAGNLLWGSTYDLSGNYMTDMDIPYDIVECRNFNSTFWCHEVIVVGEHIDMTSAAPQPDGFVLRINSNTGVGTKHPDFYGTASSNDVFTSVLQSNNTGIDPNAEGFAIGGYSNRTGSYDMWFMAMDYNMTIAWEMLYDYAHPAGNVGHDYSFDLMERMNTSSAYEYYFAGYTDQGFFGSDDAVVIKTDAAGNAVTGGQFTYGDIDLDRGIRIDQLNGFGSNTDGISVFGYSNNVVPYIIGGFDNYLVKAYFNGVTACQYDLRTPNQVAVSSTHIAANTSEFWPNTFFDFPFHVDFARNLLESPICQTASDPDGDNARIAPAEPKGVKQAVISPNPMQQGAAIATVELETEAATQVSVAIYDVLGKEYYNSSFTLAKGKNQLPVDISNANMAAGMYTVKISGLAINKNILLMVK